MILGSMTRSTRTSVPGVPAAPSLRGGLAAAAAEYGLRPLNCAIPLNTPGIWFARNLIAAIMSAAGPPPSGTIADRGRAGAVRGEWVRAPAVPEADLALRRAAQFLGAALAARTDVERVS